MVLECGGRSDRRLSEADSGTYDLRVSEAHFIEKCSSSGGKERCLYQMIAEASSGAAGGHEPHDGGCGNLAKLCASPREAESHLGFPFVLVSHVATHSIDKHTRDPKKQVFAVLTVSPGASPSAPGRVFSITADGLYIYRLRPEYADLVLSVTQRQRNLPSLRPRDALSEPPAVPKVTEGGDAVRVDARDGAARCCDPCSDSRSYERHMDRAGPQKPYVVKTSGFDHLRILGLFSPDAEKKLLRCCELSMAAFDVESMNVEVCHDDGNEDLVFRVETVSRTPMPRRPLTRQVPALLSWSDALRTEEGLEPLVYDFEDQATAVASFVADLTAQRDRAVSCKHEILADLFAWLGVFRSSHFSFFDCREEPPTDAEEEEEEEEDKRWRLQVRDSWRNSVFGLAERQLEALANRYLVWGFNAEAYDLVILCSALATHLKSDSRSGVKMQREGGKIRSFRFDNILLLEAKRLVAPGFSLARLAEMCGLEESKGIFPFDLFVCKEFLSEPRLPADCRGWANRLNPLKTPSQAEVDAVQEFFDASGFKSVGEYLVYYLRLDVVLLLKSVVRLSGQLYDKLGLHVADSGKFTISSLATAASQSYLARNKRPANFFPNNAKIYSVSACR
jgi:hypothetical protein